MKTEEITFQNYNKDNLYSRMRNHLEEFKKELFNELIEKKELGLLKKN